MRIVVHPPTVEAPDGTEHIAAIVLAAVREQIRELGAGTGSTGEPEAAAAAAEQVEAAPDTFIC